MQDNPPPADILDTVIDHLRDRLLPSVQGRAVFELRVAISALELVRRQMRLEPESDAAELGRLQALLDEDGDLLTLNATLSAAIAAGEFDVHSPGLLEHLHRTALEKLAVDQPNYAAYQRAVANNQQDRPWTSISPTN
jgi:Domain of unknown function (DUF6285)